MCFSIGALEAQRDEETHLMKETYPKSLPASSNDKTVFFFLKDMHFSTMNLVEKSQLTPSEY